jgi:hypothetical protein
MTGKLRAAYWLTPIAFCLALYWLGLRIWFAQDDFAWLNLRNMVFDLRSFLWAMFAPLAQGTIRPFSERGFFMLFSYFFGLRALPYRVFVFLNQFLNIILVMLVTRKLTRSDLAGFLAPLFWLSNIALITPMAWNSSYNEIQCASFLLLSFYLFIRYAETGERRFYRFQWVTFLLGFGALEINVVYPAIAALYAVLFARRYFRSTLPMFGVSVVFAVIDRWVGHQSGNFYYDMNFHPASMLQTLDRYWTIFLGLSQYAALKNWPDRFVFPASLMLTLAILLFTAWKSWNRKFVPLFCIAWFFIVLGPLLPLHNHVTDYYLSIPAMGVAILAAYACALAWRQGWATTALAAALALLYLVPSISIVHAGMLSDFNRADRVRALIQSVAYAKHIHPGKMILLKGVDDELFWAGIYDSPFHIFGWNDVLLTPDSRSLVRGDPHLNPVDDYYLPQSATVAALNSGAAVVYAVEGRQLRNVTRPYQAWIDSQPPPPLASSIDLGLPIFDQQLGEGWYQLEQNFRWSHQHAVVYLPGPAAPGEKLRVHGYATVQEMKPGPLHLALSIAGRAMPVQTIGPGLEFRFEYDLPSDLVGRPKIEVAFNVDRTFQPSKDGRKLGLVFGQFAIR